MISIIIANYNGLRFLDACLDSLLKTSGSNKFEVIVVDNNSSDDSITLIKKKFPSVRLIALDKNIGYAAANNLAARQASGNYYVFLNNDTRVTESWLSELMTELKSESAKDEIAIIQSFLVRENGVVDSSGDFVDKIGRPYSSKLENPPNGREILSARGACMLVRKEMFWKLGGFEEDFFASFEDVHLGWKTWIAGYRVVLAPNSVVYHIGGQTVKRIKKQMDFNGMKNQICVILLDFEFPLGIKNLFSLLLLYLPAIQVSSSKTNDPRQLHDNNIQNSILLKDVLKTIVWLIANSFSLYKRYKAISRTRVRTTRELAAMGLITNDMYEK